MKNDKKKYEIKINNYCIKVVQTGRQRKRENVERGGGIQTKTK